MTGLLLDKKFVSLNLSETLQLNATTSPAKATNKKLVWSSSNPDVAKVSGDGNITAQKTGLAEIDYVLKHN